MKNALEQPMPRGEARPSSAPVNPACVEAMDAPMRLALVDGVECAPIALGGADALAAAAGRHGLLAQHVDVLRLMFHEEGYRRELGLADALCSSNVFLHYIEHGLARDVPPGPFFDRGFCRTAMQAAFGTGLYPGSEDAAVPKAVAEWPFDRPIVVAWLTCGLDRCIAPTPYFDPDYYRARYPDCVAAEANPLVHFLEHGRKGQRAPSLQISHLAALIASYSGDVPEPLWRVLALMPRTGVGGALPGGAKPNRLLALLPPSLRSWVADDESDKDTIGFFGKFVQPEFYEAQLPKGMTVPPGQHAVHCLVEGLPLGLRPSILFSPDHCREALAGLAREDEDLVRDDPGRLFLLWLYVGLAERIVPTPLFDEQYYLACYPALRRRRKWPFIHFVLTGLKQNRRPHRLLSHSPRTELGDVKAAFPDRRLAQAAKQSERPFNLSTTSRLELACEAGEEKLARLELPDMQDLIAQAAAVEPLVTRPTKHGVAIWPPDIHHVAAAVRAGRVVRRALPRTTYDTILFMSECRTLQEAQTAVRYVQQLRKQPAETLLLVITDGAYVDQSACFGAALDVLHLTSELRDLRKYQRVAVLLDLVRGVHPKNTFNLNSRLARHMFKRHGKQLGHAVSPAQIACPTVEPQETDRVMQRGQASARLAPQPDISAIITAHREGALAATTLRSYLDCAADAERNGLRVQKIAVLDRPDTATRTAFANFATGAGDMVVEVDFGDQGLSRNGGVECATGKTVAFLDGDDLWSRNWLGAAWALFTACGKNTIVHPEFSLYFGVSRNVLIATDQTDPFFDVEFLRFGNCFDALCLADRETHLRFPYCLRDMKGGYAYEDWHWNCVTIEAGFSHRVARGTIHFKRHRRWSQNAKANMRGALVRPSELFGYDWYAENGARDLATAS